MAITPVHRKFATDIGDGIESSITVTHGFQTKDVIVQIRETSSSELVMANVKLLDENRIEVTFAVAPSMGQYRIVVLS